MFDVKLIENDEVVVSGKFSGFLDNNIINYNDGVNNIIDLNKLVLERVSGDYRIVFDFNELSCDYVVNDLSVKMLIELIDKEICSNGLFLKYKLVDTGNIYEYSVKW